MQKYYPGAVVKGTVVAIKPYGAFIEISYEDLVTDLEITEGDQEESVEKFEGKVNTLADHTTYKLSDIFELLDNDV